MQYRSTRQLLSKIQIPTITIKQQTFPFHSITTTIRSRAFWVRRILLFFPSQALFASDRRKHGARQFCFAACCRRQRGKHSLSAEWWRWWRRRRSKCHLFSSYGFALPIWDERPDGITGIDAHTIQMLCLLCAPLAMEFALKRWRRGRPASGQMWATCRQREIGAIRIVDINCRCFGTN